MNEVIALRTIIELSPFDKDILLKTKQTLGMKSLGETIALFLSKEDQVRGKTSSAVDMAHKMRALQDGGV